MAAVLFGAFCGGLAGCSDRGIAAFPHWVIEGAVISSTIANAISYWYY